MAFVVKNGFKKTKLQNISIASGNTESRMEHFKKTGDAKTGATNMPLAKTAQYAGSSSMATSRIAQGNPNFYSPIHTAVQWGMPTKTREVRLWQITENAELMREDYTFINIKDFVFYPKSIVDDTLTNGHIYENVDSEPILAGDGLFKVPLHISKRECEDKRSVKIRVFGNWRELELSEEHNVFYLPSKMVREPLARHKQKMKRNGFRGLFGGKQYIESINWEIKKTEADQLRVGDFLVTPITQILNSRVLDISDDLLWLIGFCIADGSVYGTDRTCSVRFNMNIEETSIIFNIERILKENDISYSKTVHTQSEKCIRISTCTRDSYDFFRSFMVGTLENKKFTNVIRKLNKEQILHVLGGYFDGDGTFTKAQHKLVPSNASVDMADQLYAMCLSCGIHVSINKKRRIISGETYHTDNEICYETFVPASDVNILKPYMKSEKIPEDYNYHSIDRTLKFFFNDSHGNRYYAQQIRYIEEFYYTGNGYDLQINPEHSYVCSGFKVSNCRFFSANDPTIASALRFLATFPFHGFENVINDPIRKEHFDALKKRLKIEKMSRMAAYEFFSLGDSFPFISFQCEACNGSGVKRDGSHCNHENGTIRNITILNPDWVDVKINPLDPDNPIITLLPDDTLKQIVASGKPPEIYEKIPDSLKLLIRQNEPIPLSPNNVTHMKHDEIPYMAYGRSLIAPLFPTLAYQDKLRQTQWIVADRHILPIRLCKVGNEQRPASNADIDDLKSQLAATTNDPTLTLVTHHAFEMDFIGASGKVLQLTKEYDLINDNITRGMGVNGALLAGDSGTSYSTAAIGIEAMIKRLKTVQDMIGEWICEKIYRAEAIMQGFYKKNLAGENVLDYPEIRWNDLNLRDESQAKQMELQLWEKKIVSTKHLCEKFEIDYDVETERVRLETQYQQQMGISPGGGQDAGGLGGGFGGGGGGGASSGGGGLGDLLGGGGEGAPTTPGGTGAPGLPNDSIAPSMSGGDVPKGGSGSGGPSMAAYDTQLKNKEQALKVLPVVIRPNKRPLFNPKAPKIKEEKPAEMSNKYIYDGPRTGMVRLTEPEMILYSMIAKGVKANNLPADFVWQKKPEPIHMSRVVVDGFFPSLKLIVEADGKRWHNTPEDIAKDQNRDYRLSRLGWKILRFRS